MELGLRIPQLDEMLDQIRALSDKIDALALAAASPGPVQLDVPLVDKPSPAPKAKRASRAA